MKVRYMFLLTALCCILSVLGCSCDESSKSQSGVGDENSPAKIADVCDGWLVSTNSDGAEFNIKVEKTGKESFRIHYVFTNKGTEAMNVLSYGIEYEMFITSSKSDGTSSDKAEPKKLNLILGGAIFHKYEYPPNYGVLRVNKSLKGSIDVIFPLQAAPNRPFTGPNMGKDKDQLYEMAKGKDGLVCILTYCYGYGFGPPSGDRPRGEKTGVKQIDSKPIVLKISELEDGDATQSAEPASKDEWLVSTNPDGLELKVKAEKTGEESFKINYVLTNKGSKPIYRVVPNDLFWEGTMPGYFFLIRPFDVACGEPGSEKLIEDPGPRDFPKNAKAKELVVLFGLNVPEVDFEAVLDWADYEELGVGKSISGSVDIRFPVKRRIYFNGNKEGRGEDDINGMAKSESGVPCIVAFAYGDRSLESNVPPDVPYWGGNLIESKRLMLKIEEE